MNPSLQLEELCRAFLAIEDAVLLQAFLRDLCTPAELAAMAERWRVCRLLQEGKRSYREVGQLTGASLTTVVRVARFLKDEPYHGYRQVLSKLRDASTASLCQPADALAGGKAQAGA